jgi:hypothetical protein
MELESNHEFIEDWNRRYQAYTTAMAAASKAADELSELPNKLAANLMERYKGSLIIIPEGSLKKVESIEVLPKQVSLQNSYGRGKPLTEVTVQVSIVGDTHRAWSFTLKQAIGMLEKGKEVMKVLEEGIT